MGRIGFISNRTFYNIAEEATNTLPEWLLLPKTPQR